MPSTLFKNAALLDPLQPELLMGHDVLVEDTVIKEVSDRPIQATADRTIDLKGKTLMPGLIDLHVHTIAIELNLAAQAKMPNVLVTLRSTLILKGMLRRGFTTVRDAGGAGHAMKQAIETGLADGPRLFVSGRALSQTGGHGDGRARSDYLASDSVCPCCVRVGALARVADGVDGVRRAVREELQMGADQIKIMASGGVASPTDPVGAFGYSEDEISAIVDEAHGRQTYVLAHAYTAAAIARAVRCGVRTIEHGNLVDGQTARLMAEKGAYVVPTLITYEALANEGAQFGLPPESVAKIADVRDAGLRSLEIYRKAGVKMGYGSDLLGPSQRLQSEEFRIRAEIQGAREVIASATVIGAEVLGMEGKLGRIVPDALADLLVVDGNPLRDVSCLLGQGEHIPLVMKAGKVQFDRLAA
ncbi:amidohydrolase family protein [Bradyrhizobium sp. WYCCWR 13023]|uniref:Amidohydrolase family protein n=1 Tax=Bradyrhizobium zhengyangense TaxID=2911009 RepID=A0A9X1U9R8_9BRAD|nr:MULTISPECIES: amidohydrolase family protein [Bradyrhizobium]MCG2627659.1 amidohydrolase family protein [Bradyrhizobium zhengyangense]MCG2668717.1 amidohydrolase family protein [Bradyrhizobium zhengyangense]MDA9526329.1 peptidase M38 [Bradyrhizobium sp. CCBAU 11434]